MDKNSLQLWLDSPELYPFVSPSILLRGLIKDAL
jgi:hypothetical protein